MFLQGDESYYGEYNKLLRPLVAKSDELRRLLRHETDLTVPGIAIIGNQSSGKSPVIHSVCGIAPPTGSGIVTRCPLELRLRSGPDLDIHISYKPCSSDATVEKPLASLEEVTEAIADATEQICGSSKGISSSSIIITVAKPSLPNIALIDLPGLVATAGPGQPPDIKEQIERMVHTYIERECVTW